MARADSNRRFRWTRSGESSGAATTGSAALSRPRVLLIAEAANPEWVSVPLIGWSLANALREVADILLVTQVRNRKAILRAGYREDVDFISIDNERVARPLYKLGQALRGGSGVGWTATQAFGSLAYLQFEREVWTRFRSDLCGGCFDLVHRVTPVSPTAPSLIASKLRAMGIPFVVGPLNGGVPWPPEFDRERRREREWLSYVRGAYKALPGRSRSLKAASAILAGSRHTAGELPAYVQDRVIWLPENAVDPARLPDRRPKAAATLPLHLCFLGRLVPYKGPDMALEAALPLLRDGRATLDIVGDGPMREPLAAAIERFGVSGSVTLHGRLEHREAMRKLAEADVLTFPSIREFGGGVVLEAMALGVVPFVVDYAGPGELVAGDVGVALPLQDRQTIVRSLTVALSEAADDPVRLSEMSQASRRLVEARFTWAAKAAQIAQVYDWALGYRAERPSFQV